MRMRDPCDLSKQHEQQKNHRENEVLQRFDKICKDGQRDKKCAAQNDKISAVPMVPFRNARQLLFTRRLLSRADRYRFLA